MWKFLGQGLNPRHSSNQSHCSDSAGALTCCTAREPPPPEHILISQSPRAGSCRRAFVLAVPLLGTLGSRVTSPGPPLGKEPPLVFPTCHLLCLRSYQYLGSQGFLPPLRLLEGGCTSSCSLPFVRIAMFSARGTGPLKDSVHSGNVK